MQTGKLSICVLLAGTIILCACSMDDDESTVVNDADQAFVMQAGYGNAAEVDLGKLAVSKAAGDGVKDFGQMMVDDHGTAQQELKDIARTWNISMPEQPDSIHQQKHRQLEAMSGTTFDTAYMHGQIIDHEKTIALFEAEMQNGENKRIKDYAGKYLPVIRMHLEKADSLAAAY
ncbi:DUF4142 domain-containing protein [Compostibacter hankyongensis]|uniref:DUF4142 domain-containing protein n=1 Tax=Compostibacter hankyongensis TaxID=1007089 RepID=A0ABP8FWV6_9BACT